MFKASYNVVNSEKWLIWIDIADLFSALAISAA